MTNELEQAMVIGNNLGIILLQVAKVPQILAGPVVAIFGAAAFFIGAKYERRWAKKHDREPLPIEDLNKILVNQEEETHYEGEGTNAQ